MPRVTCRCGLVLSVPVDGPERVDCPQCSAKIRVRRASPNGAADDGDGFLRFACPCGRRLKIRLIEGSPPPQAGKCPDCGQTVPVPDDLLKPPSDAKAGSALETPTQELSTADLAALEAWARPHLAKRSPSPTPSPSPQEAETGPNVSLRDASPPPTVAVKTVPLKGNKVETGLRVCPRCGRPIHLGADACRDCGAHVPRR